MPLTGGSHVSRSPHSTRSGNPAAAGWPDHPAYHVGIDWFVLPGHAVTDIRYQAQKIIHSTNSLVQQETTNLLRCSGNNLTRVLGKRFFRVSQLPDKGRFAPNPSILVLLEPING